MLSWCLALPLAQAGGVAETLGSGLSAPWKVLVLFAILVGTTFAAIGLGRAFRMADHTWRFWLMAFSIIAAAVITVLGWPPKLGIDLSGGVNLVYEVDPALVPAGQTVEMDKLIAALTRRINPAGTREISIRPFGPRRVEIVVPDIGAAEVDKLVRQIGNIGTLEFRILANRNDHEGLITAADQQPKRMTLKQGDFQGQWVPVEAKPETIARYWDLASGQSVDSNLAVRFNEVTKRPEVLVVIDIWHVTGEYLSGTNAAESKGKPCVNFRFNAEGAKKFGNLTRENLPDENAGISRLLGIVLDGNLVSAPAIRDVITDSGEITGDFTEEEVDDLVGVLNAGSLPTALGKEPVARRPTDATLGKDTIVQGTYALVGSVLATVLFIIFYYRFAGVVAAAAVVINLLLTVAVAITIQAAFTLPGLAGLALTLGMAVDANVLIYERIREEMARGATLRMAIRNGFDRAMGTIIDSNLTTIITAIILYWRGTAEIKGFAVMLFLGLVISMFTACFCSRVVFDVFEKMRWIKQLRFRQMFGLTNINFVAGMGWCLMISGIVLAVGAVAAAGKSWGWELLDIEFTGGVAVETVFDEPQDIAYVRDKVSGLRDVRVRDISPLSDQRGLRFQVTTTESKIEPVEEELARVFGDQLSKNSIVAGIDSVKPITRPSTEEPSTEEPSTEEPSTEEPGTEEPGTEEPGTDEPGTDEPSTDEPSTDEPSTDEPSTDEPSTDEPSTDEPSTDEPSTDEPSTDEPSTDEPSTDEPSTDEPSTDEPSTDEPSTDEPGTEVPSTEEPGVEESSDETEDSPQPSPDDGSATPTRVNTIGADAAFQNLLAQVEPGETPAEVEPPTEPAASEETTADESAAEEQQPEADPAASDPAESPPAEADPSTPARETTPDEPEAAVEEDAPAETSPLPGDQPAAPDIGPARPPQDPFAGGTETTVTLAEGLAKETLEEIFKQAVAQQERAAVVWQLEADDAGYVEGDSKPYKTWRVRLSSDPEASRQLLTAIKADMESRPVFPSSSEVGASVAGTSSRDAMVALVLSWLGITAYLWFRFQKVMYGVAAVVALIHDVLMALTFLAISHYVAPLLGFAMIDPFKIDLTVIAALLTIIGFSVNDTVVVFDRVREVKGKSPDLTPAMINDSVNQTLSRTVLTSLTVFMITLILYIWGGPSIHAFAFTLLIGVITGTYSTIYIAAPILLWMTGSRSKSAGEGLSKAA